MTRNLPTLEQIAGDPALAFDISIEGVAALLEECDQQSKLAAAAKKALNGSIEGRYANAIGAAYDAQSKDFGTVRVSDGAYEIVADRAKKVEWDQAALAAAGDKIAAAGDDPHEYLDVSYGVSERKYTAWPEHIRKVFEPARTVRPGAMSIKLVLKEAA